MKPLLLGAGVVAILSVLLHPNRCRRCQCDGSPPVERSTGKPQTKGIAHGPPLPLTPGTTPPELWLDAYVSREHQRQFAHAEIFQGCEHNVLAVLDAIRPYLQSFFQQPLEKADSVVLRLQGDDGRSDAAPPPTGWRRPVHVAHKAAVSEFIMENGVDPSTFAPEKVLHLPAQASLPSIQRVFVGAGALVLGGTFDLSDGSIHIGRDVRIEPNVYIKGPAIIGDDCTVRSGAYLRGDLITGRGVVLRGEVKNALIMDHAELCHPGYCGDSVCGVQSHFGNQVTTANLNLFASSDGQKRNLTIAAGDQLYDSGRSKIGVVLGDNSQLGCSTVTDPCTLVQRDTVVYPLTRLRKGIYGPNVIIKNDPMAHGVLEIVPLRASK